MAAAEMIVTAFVGAIGVWQLWYARRAWLAWRGLRGDRIVTCPETGWPAGVRVDVPHAALTALGHGRPALRLADCSRWRSRGRCDEPCLPEARQPESAVGVIAAHWFDGKKCVYCGSEIGSSDFLDHHPAVTDSGGGILQWTEVAADTLPEVLRQARPVCWNCYVAETFRTAHPELVTDRPRRPA